MTETNEILTRCQQLGIRLSLGLRVEGWSKAPADLQEAIRQYKQEILALLRNQADNDDELTQGASMSKTSSNVTHWGIPIPEGWDANDPVFRRHPMECDCFRAGVLRCGVPCVWAWPPGAEVGDNALPLNRIT